MLNKLLKYDLKSGLRTFGFLWIGIALVAGVDYLFLSLGSQDNEWRLITEGITMMPLLLTATGAMVYPYIYAAVRFHKGLLGREGYLMFTLPSSPWKLLLSKLITAIFFAIVTILLSTVGIAVAFRGLMESNEWFLPDLWEMKDLFKFEWEQFLSLMESFVKLVTGILHIYLALCLGHLFRSRRILWAAVFYFIIHMGVLMLSSMVEGVFIRQMLEGLPSAAENRLYFNILLELSLGMLYFFLSERILRTKLNLE